MEDVKKVLEMIEQGQITSEEGMTLIEALKNSETENDLNLNMPTTVSGNQGKVYQFLRVRVTSEDDETNVKVNIPLSLVKAIGSIASLESFVPEESRKNTGGFDFSSIDIDEIMKAIEEGTMGDGTIVDVEAKDEHGKKIWVKVYVD